MTSGRFDVVAIGNAIVDVLCHTDEQFLDKNGLTKGSMCLVGDEESRLLYEQLPPGLEKSGGSAANTIAGLASFGSNVGFIGKVSNDQLGQIFTHDLRSIGVAFDSKVANSNDSTARSLIMVTPDAQRTMATYLGVSTDLGPDDIDENMMRNTSVLCMEAYLWDHESAQKAFMKAAEIVKSNGGKVAFSLSDKSCVTRHRHTIRELINWHVDILFANELEIIELFQSPDFDTATRQCRNVCEVAALTRSEKGSTILSGDMTINIPAKHPQNLIDTTGAGDLYASGFLYGYTRGMSLEKCGALGSLSACEVISHFGARPEISLRDLAQQHGFL